MFDIVVVGGGGHARVLLSILRGLGNYRVIGYTDIRDNGPLLDAPFLGGDRELIALARERRVLNAAIGVGQTGLGSPRRDLWERLSSQALLFPRIVAAGAIVNDAVSGGEAAVVMSGAVVNSGARFGRGVIVNTNSTVEHDVVLGDWVHVAPGATVCGAVEIGSCSMVGAGATIIEGRKIASGCIIGAGATVVHNLTEPGIYVGCPARRAEKA